MYAVASQLDPVHEALVHRLWEELDVHHRVRLRYPRPIAHISYMVFSSKPGAELQERLRFFAQRHEPFVVRAGGLGLFPGSPAVLYIPVVRSARLTLFHYELWNQVYAGNYASSVLYHPERWVPHITLAQLNLRNMGEADVIVDMAERRLDWQIVINSLALINATHVGPGLDYVLPFAQSGTRRVQQDQCF